MAIPILRPGRKVDTAKININVFLFIFLRVLKSFKLIYFASYKSSIESLVNFKGNSKIRTLKEKEIQIKTICGQIIGIKRFNLSVLMAVGEVSDHVKTFLDKLQHEKFNYSNVLAEETVKLLEKIINLSDWKTAKELIGIVKQYGKQLIEAQPTQTAVGNMIKRVLKIIRDEYSSSLGKNEENDPQESLQKLLVSDEQLDYGRPLATLKESIADSIRELLLELETSPDNIASQALEHIHSDEVIMTLGKSRTVEKFLKKASAKRKFHVIVAEAAPFHYGQDLAYSLAEHGIETTLIHDSAISATLSRVNKVIIGTHSVMANGGLKALCGTHSLAISAKHYSVPLIVCAPMFKLTPQYVCSADQEGFNHMMSPLNVLSFSGGEILSEVQVYNPAFDYVPPELVTLFVSNIGGNSPSYVYRLLSELYYPDDFNIS